MLATGLAVGLVAGAGVLAPATAVAALRPAVTMPVATPAAAMPAEPADRLPADGALVAGALVDGAPSPGSVDPASLAAACAPAELSVELTGVQGGAGQVHAALVLVNKGGATCVLAGHPAVFQVDGSGAAVGAPALADGPRGPSVILRPGERAVAGLTATNASLLPGWSPGAAVAAGIRVIPPGGDGVLEVAGFPEGEWAALRVTAFYPF